MDDLTPERLKVNGVDLSGFVSNLDMSHDADDKGRSGEYLAGLETTTITLDNSGGFFERSGNLFFPPPQRRVQVTIAVPDGRWQGVKQRLKRFWPLRWLKVRYRDYSFEAEFDQWSEDGLSGHAVSSVERDVKERR